MGVLVAYVKLMGVNTDLLFLSSMVHPANIRYLSQDEVANFNLDNMRDRTTPWIIQPYKGGIVAQSSVTIGPREPEYLTISCRREDSILQIMYSSKVLPGVTASDIKGSAFDYEIKVDNVTIKKLPLDSDVSIRRTADGMLFVSYYLPMTIAKAIAGGSKISLNLNVPHVYGFSIGRAFSLVGSSPYVNAALKNCI